MINQVIQTYNEAIFDTDRAAAMKIVHEAVDQGVSPEDIIFKVVVPAIELMIKSATEDFDVNLAQHFMTSQIAGEITEEMIKRFENPPLAIGKIVIGTSIGDFHGLGKKIVISCLKAQMIDAVDLGQNVSAEKFVDKAILHHAQVIGISSMMVHTAKGENGSLKVRKLLKEKGLEDKIKIVVGGAPYRFDSKLYKAVEADNWAPDGIKAVKVITELIKEVKS